MSRVGLGYDVHQLVEGRRLVLGGVEFPGTRGLAGHSDADVLLHAIMDALLGAAGLGDIGEHFPPSDERWRDSDSLALLRIVREKIPVSWSIENVDATLVAEYPKVGPRRAEMCRTIADALGIDVGRVNIKATTNEQMGFVGRGEGIAALAVASLSSSGRTERECGGNTPERPVPGR